MALSFGIYHFCKNGPNGGHNPTIAKIRRYCAAIKCPFLGARPRTNKAKRQQMREIQAAQEEAVKRKKRETKKARRVLKAALDSTS